MILDRDIAELCRGIYAYPGDTPVTWNYVDTGEDTGVYLTIKQIGDVSAVICRGTSNLIPDAVRDLEAAAEVPDDAPEFGDMHPGGNKGTGRAVAKILKLNPKSIIVGGHSLGALHADNVTGYLVKAGKPPLARVVFGEPRPGYRQFADYIKQIPARSYRNDAGLFGDPVAGISLPTEPFVVPSRFVSVDASPALDDLWGPVAPHRIQLYTQALANVTTGTEI